MEYRDRDISVIHNFYEKNYTVRRFYNHARERRITQNFRETPHKSQEKYTITRGVKFTVWREFTHCVRKTCIERGILIIIRKRTQRCGDRSRRGDNFRERIWGLKKKSVAKAKSRVYNHFPQGKCTATLQRKEWAQIGTVYLPLLSRLPRRIYNILKWAQIRDVVHIPPPLKHWASR